MTDEYNTNDGEQEAWAILQGLDPQLVKKRTLAGSGAGSKGFSLMCLGRKLDIDPAERVISTHSRQAQVLLQDLGCYTRLSILRYLVHCPEEPLHNEWIKPASIPGGRIFDQGTHVLPLNEPAGLIQKKPGSAKEACAGLGGQLHGNGDLSMILYPMPRFPVLFIFWYGDEEFAPVGSILIDALWRDHLPVDITWAAAKLSFEMLFNQLK
ncbi:DUF3786 domain-containing protein [Desulfonatronospira sp.]|uniref:DUF3786 domain-containing protein n=1 Tax=Desulfonatronospira sp. TaxID=1962951 RepID=UPI0025C0BCE4|nr:DUF3786 domain-containing protein [Desulfonatronospira sp.]